jgi:endogenous inhibitor of DNA gyrase (YacG/DUF329 family)
MKKSIFIAILGLLVLALLPVLGRWARDGNVPRCPVDGAVVEPLYRVRVSMPSGQSREFCCVRCAEVWLEGQAVEPDAVTVTDEATGKEIDSSRAYFVRSRVVTAPVAGNRVHVFEGPTAAAAHAAAHGGRVLADDEEPFR